MNKHDKKIIWIIVGVTAAYFAFITFISWFTDYYVR